MSKPKEYMRTTEVAALFRVSAKTVNRWALQGRLPESTRTIGGHRRWKREEIVALHERYQRGEWHAA